MTIPSDNQPWLDQTVEEPLDPSLPICDPHHHLWDMRGGRVSKRYLLDEILADTGSGHSVESTVFIECGAMYKADGPEVMRPVGETEFVNGVAAMSDSGLYGPTRVAAGIVGTADLRLGDGAAPVLDAHIAAGGGRFRGIRHSAAWDADPDVSETIKRTKQPYFVLQGNICALLATKDHVNIFLYDGAIVPDPEGILTAGHDNKTARTVAVLQGGKINARALTTMFKQIIANNRAGGWRKLKGAS